MNFIEVARIGRISAAIIDSAAQRKLDICKEYYNGHRKNRFKDRSLQDDWERLCWALSWESRFYRQGLKKGFGIMVLFDELFEIVGEDKGPSWADINSLGVLRCLTFTSDPGQDIRSISYEKEPFEPESEAAAYKVIERYLLEEIRRGVALAHWTDSQITDRMDYPLEAVAKWAQIIDQAKRFYAYSAGCEVKIGYNREELTFHAPGGVFAIPESQIPHGLEVEEIHEN